MSKQIRINGTHKKQLQTVVKNLNKIINAIREYIPEANIFFNGEGIVSLNIHSIQQRGLNKTDNKYQA